MDSAHFSTCFIQSAPAEVAFRGAAGLSTSELNVPTPATTGTAHQLGFRSRWTRPI